MKHIVICPKPETLETVLKINIETVNDGASGFCPGNWKDSKPKEETLHLYY